jgi:hypothetical protein
VSVGSGPREAFCRLPDGSYEVFEEKAGLTSNRSLWVSGTASKVIDTLPFDVVPAEMQVTKNMSNIARYFPEARRPFHPVGRRRLLSLNTLLSSLTMFDVFYAIVISPTYCNARPSCRYVQEVPVVENLDDIDQSSSLWRYGVD